MKDNNINNNNHEKYKPLSEEIKNKSKKNIKNEEEKNNIINNEEKESVLTEESLIEKRIDLSSNPCLNLIDEEESKDILLSIDKKNFIYNNINLNIDFEKNNDLNNDDNLEPKIWKYKDKKNFNEIEEKFKSIKILLNKEEVKKIKKGLNKEHIKSILLNIGKDKNKNNKIKIKKIRDLKDNNKDKNFMELKNSIYKLRKVYKDNNSFYRCIIFSVFENMILINNIMFFKELLINIDSISSPITNDLKELKSEVISNINIDLIKQLIYILIKSMSKNIYESYEILIKIYLIYNEFDYGMILILRWFLCEYINNNKFKIFSENEQIEISDLLPTKYKEMHISFNKKFELYYINELLNMKSYESNIIYHLIVYYLNINLNILYYKPDSDNAMYDKKYKTKENKNNISVNLLYYEKNFSIYYQDEFYEFHYKTLALYEEDITKEDNKDNNIIIINNIEPEDNDNNNKENNIVDNENHNDKNNNENTFSENFICESCKKEYNTKDQKENIFKFCPECLDTEFKNSIYQLYLTYLQYVNHNNRNYKNQRDIYFINMLQKTKKNNISLLQAMKDNGYVVYELINIIKKDICLICFKEDLQKFYFELPCGCRLCSKKCFNKYFEIMINKNFNKMCNNSYKNIIFLMEYCICGTQYFYDDFLKLYTYFQKKGKIKECDMIIKIVKNRWYWKCLKCDNNFDPFCLNKRLFLSDDKIYKDFYGKQLKHLICSNCYDVVVHMKKQKNVECYFCKSEHYIVGRIGLNYQNKYPETCNIF